MFLLIFLSKLWISNIYLYICGKTDKLKAEITSNDLKRYYKTEFGKGYYNELRDKIIPLIKEGVPIAEIIKNFSLKTEQIAFLITHKDVKQNDFIKPLGSKKESYYTEDEMLKPISYGYNDLSPDEKLIYNNENYD